MRKSQRSEDKLEYWFCVSTTLASGVQPRSSGSEQHIFMLSHFTSSENTFLKQDYKIAHIDNKKKCWEKPNILLFLVIWEAEAWDCVFEAWATQQAPFGLFWSGKGVVNCRPLDVPASWHSRAYSSCHHLHSEIQPLHSPAWMWGLGGLPN